MEGRLQRAGSERDAGRERHDHRDGGEGDGTYRLDGELFASGGTVRAENGNLYTLSLEEGEWKAGFNAPAVNVTLGASGTTITMEVREDGTYRLDGELFREWRHGEGRERQPVHAEPGGGGMEGRLQRAGSERDAGRERHDHHDGGEGGRHVPARWRAFREWRHGEGRERQPVHAEPGGGGMEGRLQRAGSERDAGPSGTTITMEVGEDGTYRLDGELFASGGTVRAENGNLYTLSLEEGEWKAGLQRASSERDAGRERHDHHDGGEGRTARTGSMENSS